MYITDFGDSLNNQEVYYITMKRLIALLLCLAALLCVFAGCSKEQDEENPDMGAYVHMYLTDPVYNFDPAYAYQNESVLKVVSLLYDNLFVLNDDGKVEKSLVKKYKYDKEENTLLLTLRNDSYWTDGTVVSANDVVFAWQRILDSSASFDAAVLLYDVKNARAAKEGDVNSIDDVGIQALNKTEILIEFEEGVDCDSFLRKLTSYALVPLRSDVLDRTSNKYDWAKSTTTIVTSGPFRIRTLSYEKDKAGLVLERNSYYRRDFMNDPVDKSVTPYRLIIDFTKSDEDILTAYENGEIFYVGNIPYSLRTKYTAEEWEDKATITDGLSTHSYIFNENAVIRYYNAGKFSSLSSNKCVYDDTLVDGQDGDKIFANADVRNALSLAIDRTAIANQVVFAEAANGLVPTGVFNSNSAKDMFRDNDGEGLALTANIEAGKTLLANAGINPSKYMFAISVPAYDTVHLEIAKSVQAAWGKEGLGFNVAINAIENIENVDVAVSTQAPITGVKDDIFLESYLAGKYEVAAIDYTAHSVDAFSVLATFAKGYTGERSILANSTDFFIPTHKTGYNSDEFNAKIDEAFAEKDIEKRALLLHEAEDILMKDMPIVPIIFNKNASLESKEFKKVVYNGYNLPIFTKTKLKDYERFTPVEE